MHLFSTLFTAQTVGKDFYLDDEIRKAIAWCKASRLQKVYVESFRNGLFVEQRQLEKVRDLFEEEGFLVHGCVTTTGLPRSSNVGGMDVGCYSAPETREKMTEIFKRTASVFDVVMIDDFLFTTCTCELCDAARGERSFADYHSDVMHEMSVENILKPAHEANPGCKVIIKYPLWYENFHRNGYETVRQMRDFDLIWAGTETREPDSRRWGLYPQTQAFFFMNWANKLGGGKCMGGWYDPYTCRPATYLEQARQTVLAQARESMLFCYGSLNVQKEIEEVGIDGYTPGVANTEALRGERDGLDRLAYMIENKTVVGVSVPKKPDDDAKKERYISSIYGLLGIPVNPAVVLEDQATSVILGPQAAGYRGVRDYLLRMTEKGVPVVCTKGFESMTGYRSAADVPVIDTSLQGKLPVGGDEADNWNLMQMPEAELSALRDYLTRPLGLTLRAPTRVALNLYDDDLEVLQNFNDFDVQVELDLFGRNRKTRAVKLVLSEGRRVSLAREATRYRITLPARTLAVLN